MKYLSLANFLSVDSVSRRFVWLNIFIQTAFPLAVAFTPTIVAAENGDHFFTTPTENAALQTQVYTLSEGETALLIAKKYNMSLDALRKLNQFRVFSGGFDRLRQGDELDVPMTPLPVVTWDGEDAEKPGAAHQDKQAQTVASAVSQAGRFLANSPDSDGLASIVRGLATGAMSSEMQSWLNQFGTARVRLEGGGKDFLNNAQWDLLVPLSEKENGLLFAQGSLLRIDNRTQSNMGLGYRRFSEGWMLGGNTFLDYDLSREHARMGLGLEYWRDNLKLGANSYLRLTHWKDSPDLVDYQERPANGWDIRAQAWPEVLPQLGGKLTYEQYYGKDVALFGKDNRQRNPRAITVGVNYTPIPLLTFSAEQRRGKSGENDTRFAADMTYQLGIPWRQQIDPAGVAAMRSLMGSRYSLVERNSNIVLEYRKKELIRLHMASLVAGYAGEQKSLGVSVNSQYGLQRIDWAASSLIAAGGKIVQNGGDWVVVLPDYHSGEQGINTYTLSGVAVDKKGNVSERTYTQVSVTQAAIDGNLSLFTPASVTLPANGTAQEQLVLKINDREGHPIDITANEISVQKTSRLRGDSGAALSTFTRRGAGEFVMTVTAGTMPESFSLTPTVRGQRLASANVVLTAENATALIDALDIVTDNAIADGKSQDTFRITVVDAQNNRVPGQSVSLSASHGASVTESATTGKEGTVTVPVTTVHAGETTLTATINGGGTKTLKLTFRPDQNTARITQKDLSVLPEVSVADGKTVKTITARVSDEQDNPVPDVLVTFSGDSGAVLAEKSVKTDALGHASTTMTSTVAGSSRVTASVNNSTTSKDTTFTGNSATAIVTSVTAAVASGIADGKTAVIFRATVEDRNGNPLSDIPVDWKSDKDSSIISFGNTQTLTSAQGVAETAVTSTRAYSDVVVTASTNTSSKSASPFAFVADKQNPVITALTSNKQTLTADATDAVNLSVRVEDQNGNPLSGVKVILSNSNNAVITPAQPVTDTDGVASASLTSRYAGEVNISATLDTVAEKTLSLLAMADEKTAGVTVSAEATSATAGQDRPVMLTATVIDGNGNPVSETSVAWQADHNQLNKTVSQTNAKGEAVVQLSGTLAGVTTATAVLYNGKKGSVQVTFGPGEPVQAQSQLTISPQSITADGKSTALASLTLRDRWDNPVPGQAIDWRADEKAGIDFTASEKGAGLYQALVTGTAEGVWSLNARTGTVNLETSLGLLASQDSAQIDSVTVSGADTVKADGMESVTLRAQIKDQNGNTKLKGVAVGWDTSLGTLSSRLSSTDENGIAEISLSSHTAGLAQVSAMLGGGEPVRADKLIRFTAGDISADKSSLSLTPATIVAGKESTTVTVTARDAEGNPLTGLKEKVSTNFSADLSMTTSAFSEVSTGVYEATVTGKNAGTTQVSASINDTRISQTAALTIRADNDSAIVKGSISVTPSSATVGDTVTYTAVLSDGNGNDLGAGIPVTWSANEGSTLGAQVTRTDDSGSARVTLSRQQSGTASVNLILPSGTTAAPDVIFSAGEADEERSVVELFPSVIVAGKESATLALTLRDSYGNLLTGKTVSGISDTGNVSVAESVQSHDAPGLYTMMVSSNKAGTAILSVKVGDKTLKKTRTLTVKGDTDSWQLSSVTADKISLSADDTEGVTYRATVEDAQGNPLSGVVVSWQLRGQSESYAPTSRTDGQGIAQTTVVSHTAGKLEMTAWLDENNDLPADTVTVTAGDIKRSTFGADKTIIGSDGKDTVTLTASLEDRYGNPVTGKTLIVQGADTLAGFKLSTVSEQQNGRYVATGTSTAKGQVTLHAQVDNVNVGEVVTVTVGAITPDLRFANAEQKTGWTRSYTGSQAVTGMPEGVQQLWSTADTSIATVDVNSGKLTLLKAGETRVTVSTPGNAEYNSAMATYTLTVTKVDPGLRAGTGEPINAIWAEAGERTIAATYSNNDVQGSLTPSYETKNRAVVTVDNGGKLTAVKPGTTVVTVSTPETDQFLAASANVAYVLDKATLAVNFDNAVVKTTDEETFTLQSTGTPLPADSSVHWTSSNAKVVSVSDSGTVQGNAGKGQARLTLTVVANDFYNASSGYYDVMVYTKPSISLGDVSHISRGSKSSASTWTPVFTDDSLFVTWSADTSDEFSKPESVTVFIRDADGNDLAKKEESSPSGSKTTMVEPNAALWGRTLHVALVAKGYGGIENTLESSSITAMNLQPRDIWTSLTVRSQVKTVTGSGYDTSCKESALGKDHNNYADVSGDSVNFGGKTLISPMSIKGRVSATQNGSTSAQAYFPWSHSDVKTNSSIDFGFLQIAKDCWSSHTGGYRVGVEVSYNGNFYTYWASESHGWGGNGDGMYVDRIDNF